MTSIFASVLLLGLALAMDILFLIWKRGVFAYLAAFGWAAMAVFAFNNGSLNTSIWMLGMFCLLALAVSIMLPVIFREKKAPPPPDKTYNEEAREYREYLRKMRYGDMPGYDESGRKTPGW